LGIFIDKSFNSAKQDTHEESMDLKNEDQWFLEGFFCKTTQVWKNSSQVPIRFMTRTLKKGQKIIEFSPRGCRMRPLIWKSHKGYLMCTRACMWCIMCILCENFMFLACFPSWIERKSSIFLT